MKWKNDKIKIKRKDLKYETGKYEYGFQQYETIRSFGESIYSGNISIHEADMNQTNLLENIIQNMKIRQVIYSLYQAKEITKKVYNNITNSIKLSNRVDTIFMNSENSKTSDRHTILLNLSDKINLKRSDKYVALSKLSIYYTWEKIKKS